MSSPTNDTVTVSQSWLNGVGSTVESAVGVLGPYIKQLIAGQTVQLSPADQSAVEKALSDLSGLEPAAPPPASS